MIRNTMTKTELYAEITQVIKGKPAAPLSHLPQFWQQLAKSANGTGLEDASRADYVEAARLFRYNDTPLCREALSAIGKDFAVSAYPDLDAMIVSAESAYIKRIVVAVQDLFAEFGYAVPASFYNVILDTARQNDNPGGKSMFKNKKALMQDRLQDAVLHAALLVTPVGLRMQSIFSRHNLRFTHVMNCSCIMQDTAEAPFEISLDADLKPAYLQNLVAAAFEQYGVNAATSGADRGF